MRKIIVIIAMVVGSLVAFVVWYRWDSGANHGYRFGYYGDFNRISNALVSIPGITVTQAWANRDVSLEEFGFTAATTSGATIRIAVGESDRIRGLSGNSLVEALKTEIERQTAK